jgi:hypothetical protein
MVADPGADRAHVPEMRRTDAAACGQAGQIRGADVLRPVPVTPNALEFGRLVDLSSRLLRC